MSDDQVPYAPPARMAPGRPGVWRYFLGAALIAAGVAVFAVTLIQGLGSMVSGLVRDQVPPGELRFNCRARGYTIYHEHTSQVPSGQSGNDLGALQLHFTDGKGKEVPLQPSRGSETYTFGRHSGHAILHARPEHAGVCTVSGAGGPPALIAVGPDSRLGLILLYSLASLFGGIFVGVLQIVFTYRRRAAARRS